MDFDEAELDMIRRGDMLGPKLGAKVATALETLQRERDEAVSSAAAARANFHTMQNAANELRKERDEAARIAKDSAVALTGLTPGGSEYCSYSRMLDTYFADIEACVGAVRRRYEDGHSARLALVEMRKERDEAVARAEKAESELSDTRETFSLFASLPRREQCNCLAPIIRYDGLGQTCAVCNRPARDDLSPKEAEE